MPVKPTWRKPAGIFAILLLIGVWSAIVANLADAIGEVHWAVKALFFIVAGIVWILPLKPLLRWMETGRWRA